MSSASSRSQRGARSDGEDPRAAADLQGGAEPGARQDGGGEGPLALLVPAVLETPGVLAVAGVERVEELGSEAAPVSGPAPGGAARKNSSSRSKWARTAAGSRTSSPGRDERGRVWLTWWSRAARLRARASSPRTRRTPVVHGTRASPGRAQCHAHTGYCRQGTPASRATSAPTRPAVSWSGWASADHGVSTTVPGRTRSRTAARTRSGAAVTVPSGRPSRCRRASGASAATARATSTARTAASCAGVVVGERGVGGLPVGEDEHVHRQSPGRGGGGEPAGPQRLVVGVGGDHEDVGDAGPGELGDVAQPRPAGPVRLRGPRPVVGETPRSARVLVHDGHPVSSSGSTSISPRAATSRSAWSWRTYTVRSATRAACAASRVSGAGPRACPTIRSTSSAAAATVERVRRASSSPARPVARPASTSAAAASSARRAVRSARSTAPRWWWASWSGTLVPGVTAQGPRHAHGPAVPAGRHADPAVGEPRPAQVPPRLPHGTGCGGVEVDRAAGDVDEPAAVPGAPLDDGGPLRAGGGEVDGEQPPPPGHVRGDEGVGEVPGQRAPGFRPLQAPARAGGTGLEAQTGRLGGEHPPGAARGRGLTRLGEDGDGVEVRLHDPGRGQVLRGEPGEEPPPLRRAAGGRQRDRRGRLARQDEGLLDRHARDLRGHVPRPGAEVSTVPRT